MGNVYSPLFNKLLTAIAKTTSRPHGRHPGTWGHRILHTRRDPATGREHYLHATKGWKSRRG